MGGYDFMVVLWVIFIVVGLFRIRDDYRDYIKTKEKITKHTVAISIDYNDTDI